MTATQPSRSAQAPLASPSYEQAQHKRASQRYPLGTVPLFSWCYKTLFPQPVCSHIYTKPRGCGVTAILGNSICSQFPDKSDVSSFAATHPKNARLSPSAATHTKSPSRTSFRCHTSEKHQQRAIYV